MDKIEAGPYAPPRSTLNGLAKAFRVKVEDPVRMIAKALGVPVTALPEWRADERDARAHRARTGGAEVTRR